MKKEGNRTFAYFSFWEKSFRNASSRGNAFIVDWDLRNEYLEVLNIGKTREGRQKMYEELRDNFFSYGINGPNYKRFKFGLRNDLGRWGPAKILKFAELIVLQTIS